MIAGMPNYSSYFSFASGIVEIIQCNEEIMENDFKSALFIYECNVPRQATDSTSHVPSPSRR